MLPKRNTISEIEDTQSGSIEEPISVLEIKEYLRLEGFTDVDASGDTDFEDDDPLFDVINTAVRESMESATNLLLAQREVRVYLDNDYGNIELPGPITGAVLLYDSDSDEITSATYRGGKFRKVLYRGCNMTAVYLGGYETLPAGLRLDMLRCIAQVYLNRGDGNERTLAQREVMKFANVYSRKSWLV